MASKLMKARETQQGYWEKKLNQRKDILAALGKSAQEIEKDTAVRSIKAKLRETKVRIKAITAKGAKIVEMARLKEEKKAAPPKEKSKKVVEEAAAPKESKKKAKAAEKAAEKKEPKEPKAEKPKKEPKAAPAPAPETTQE
jgi:NADH dehydrogenase/NADH:ubiquinone oxidoreductase subunit G